MDKAISVVLLVVYIAAILGISMAVTWLVVRISPSESAKEQRRARKDAAAS